MTGYGKWRVYFNRHQEAPRIWCVSPESGAWELCATTVILKALAHTVYCRDVKPQPNHAGPPSGYLSVVGTLSVDAQGVATICEVVQ